MGLSRTNARMLRFFAISSRSPVRRPKAFGNVMPLDGAGGSSGEETGSAADVCCFAGSGLAAGAVSFLPQAISERRANRGNTNTKARRGKIEVLNIYLLLCPSAIRLASVRAGCDELPQSMQESSSALDD